MPDPRAAARLPAFGRELLELRKRGMVPAQSIVISLDSWKFGENFPRLVVPADADPAELDFRATAGLDVILAWKSTQTTIVRRDAAIRAIAMHLPVRLWVVDLSAPEESFFVITRQVGVERPEYLT